MIGLVTTIPLSRGMEWLPFQKTNLVLLLFRAQISCTSVLRSDAVLRISPLTSRFWKLVGHQIWLVGHQPLIRLAAHQPLIRLHSMLSGKKVTFTTMVLSFMAVPKRVTMGRNVKKCAQKQKYFLFSITESTFAHTSVCDLWLLWQDAQIKFLMILCCSTISIDLLLQVKMTTVWKRKEARGKKKHQP